MRRRWSNVAGAVAPALIAVLAFAAPALATTANPDTIRFATPNGTMDVLANDGGPELRVTGVTQPANGTATCSALGACLYEAADGFTGPSDSFTYTATDNTGDAKTATVTVMVGASPVTKLLLALDDYGATKAGRAVTIPVLANDDGPGALAVTTASPAAQNGTVSCDATSCTYTPNAGFVGSDGFKYTMNAGDPAKTRSAVVSVLVIPADAHYDLGVTDGSGPLGRGDGAAWGSRLVTVPGGLSREEVVALPLPDATFTLTGPHAIADGSVQAAKGWSVSSSGGTVHATATSSALLGSSAATPFPTPSPPLQQGNTGGDGHVPTLAGSRVFATYHHSYSGPSGPMLSCVDRRTSDLCPGYPLAIQFATNNSPGPGVLVGHRLYFHGFPESSDGYTQSYTSSAPIGLFCWDVDTNRACGWKFVARLEGSGGDPGASQPVKVGDKIYLGGDGGKLYCYDPAADAGCGSFDTGLTPDRGGRYDAVTHGSRVFVSRRYSSGAVACIDVVAGTTCPGWDTPKSFPNNGWNLLNMHDAAGAPNGVCITYGSFDCVTDADPGTFIHYANGWGFDDEYGVMEEAEAGTRTLIPNNGSYGLYCWDWSTGDKCSGGHWNSAGFASGPASAYGAVWDGTCAVALGDQRTVFTMDTEGTTPCRALSTGTDKQVVDLRDQRCDATVGAARWKGITLEDVADGDFTSVVVTVRDADTGEKLAEGQLIDGSSVKALDLSGIDAKAHPRITYDATAQGPTSDPAWADAIPPRLRLSWEPDAQPVCFRSAVAPAGCGTPATAVGVTGHLADPADEKKAEVAVNGTADCPVPPKPVTPQSTPPKPKVCGGARLFDIRIRFLGRNIRKLTVTVNGKKQRVLGLRKYRGRPVVRIDLRKLPKTTTVVRITIQTKTVRTRSGKVKKGKTLKGKRVYHPCRGKLPDRGFRF